MKKLMLLLVLMMAPGLGGESVALSNQAAASGVPGERLDARPVHQINALDEKNHSDEKRLLRPGPTNEVEMQR